MSDEQLERREMRDALRFLTVAELLEFREAIGGELRARGVGGEAAPELELLRKLVDDWVAKPPPSRRDAYAALGRLGDLIGPERSEGPRLSTLHTLPARAPGAGS